MIKKIFTKFWCYMFGHDVIYPYPNKAIVICLRCQRKLIGREYDV